MEEIENVGTKLKKRRNFNTRRKTPQSRRETDGNRRVTQELTKKLQSSLKPHSNRTQNAQEKIFFMFSFLSLCSSL